MECSQCDKPVHGSRQYKVCKKCQKVVCWRCQKDAKVWYGKNGFCTPCVAAQYESKSCDVCGGPLVDAEECLSCPVCKTVTKKTANALR